MNIFFPQEKDNEDDLELSLYCVTCGAELNQKGALRHMEKCFSKVCCMHYLTVLCPGSLELLIIIKALPGFYCFINIKSYK